MKREADKQISKQLKLLGCDISSTMDEVKAAWRGLVKKHHPDRFKAEAEKTRQAQIMAGINRAYEDVLAQLAESAKMAHPV